MILQDYNALSPNQNQDWTAYSIFLLVFACKTETEIDCQELRYICNTFNCPFAACRDLH